jgi:hypothetical protein
MGWHVVFTIAAGFNVVAAALALLVFKPMRARHFAAVRAELQGQSAAGNSMTADQASSSSFAQGSTT